MTFFEPTARQSDWMNVWGEGHHDVCDEHASCAFTSSRALWHTRTAAVSCLLNSAHRVLRALMQPGADAQANCLQSEQPAGA